MTETALIFLASPAFFLLAGFLVWFMPLHPQEKAAKRRNTTRI